MADHILPDDQTPEGRQETLRRMRAASTAFYYAAIHTGCHAFIEYTGLMNEYINLCAEAEKAGIDWIHANVHGDTKLPFAAHHIYYLSEKLECIYGVRLQEKP